MTQELKGDYDVVVIGGGPAGLNGALMLARQRRSVLVVDAGSPRNAPADGVHGLLGHDGTPPSELLERGRDEIRRYGAEFVMDEVVAARRGDDGLVVGLAGGTSLRARRLLVTAGVVDEFPDIKGVQERWGRDVLHCAYCHGWEVRDKAIGVLGGDPRSLHQALMFRQLSDDVVYFSHTSAVNEDEAEQLAAREIRVIDGKVTSLDITGDTLTGVRMEDGTVVARDAFVIGTRLGIRASFVRDLGLEVKEHPAGIGQQVVVDPTGRTNVPGVWAAGNITDPAAWVGNSAAAGAFAGAQINGDLVAEDTRRAVEERRKAESAGDRRGQGAT